MKHQKRPLHDPDERVFTLFDVKRLYLSQKKKILRASFWGALLAFSFILIRSVPKYQVSATFKEAPKSIEGTGGLEKLLLSNGSASSQESQTATLIQSNQVLKPLVVRMGTQATVRKAGLLSRVYKRIRDNILSERGLSLSDVDDFAFQNVVYDGEKTLTYSLRFEDSEHFSIGSGKKTIASGSLGSCVRLPEAELTIVKVPKGLKVGTHYSLSIQPWVSAVNAIRSNFRIKCLKQQKSIHELKFFHRDRYFGTELLNALTEEYRRYLKRDHDQVVHEQLSYLQQKQEEICANMSSVFDEYTEYLQTNLSRSGQLGLTQEIGGITKECNVLANKISSIDLELDRLVRMEVDQKAFVPMDDTPFSRSLKDTLSAISELKQQRDLIELSLPSQSRALNELQYENKKGELKEVRDQLCAMQHLLDGIEKHTPLSQDALFDAGEYLGAWAGRLADSQEEDRKGLAEYLENAVRLLSMQEKMVQEQIHYAHDTPAAFKGIDLTTARALFLEYYKKLDQIAEGVSHFSRLADEIERGDFEISSLSAVLLDPLSQRLIQQASEIALKLKDEKHHSEKEGSRWAEELSLQKKILKEHLDQLFKLEQVKSDLVQNRIDALQAIRLGSISGQISVLQERLADSVKERKTALLKEKTILEEKVRQILNGLTDIPERWRREKWLNLKSQMGIKMVQGLTELVESKTISSHLHHVESKPLDIATLPTTPCSPGLLVKAFLGAMLAGFFVFSRAFLGAVLKGFPSTKEKLCAMGYPVLGEISTVCDGPGTEPRGADLEALRQIFLFLDKEPIPGVIEKTGIGSSDFSAGARDMAKGKAAETREGPVDLRSAEQMSTANCLGSEDEKSESKPTPHQNRFFNRERYKVKVVGLIEGKGPDYSFALAEHFSRMSLRPLVIRCDFNMKFNREDLPGVLQVWKEEISSPPLKRRQGYDLLTSGGFTPYGAEVIRSLAFQNSLDKFKKEYDFVLMVFRSPLNLADSLAPLSLCDYAIVTVSGEPTEQLTPFIDWAYHGDMCRLAILTASSP